MKNVLKCSNEVLVLCYIPPMSLCQILIFISLLLKWYIEVSSWYFLHAQVCTFRFPPSCLLLHTPYTTGSNSWLHSLHFPSFFLLFWSILMYSLGKNKTVLKGLFCLFIWTKVIKYTSQIWYFDKSHERSTVSAFKRLHGSLPAWQLLSDVKFGDSEVAFKCFQTLDTFHVIVHHTIQYQCPVCTVHSQIHPHVHLPAHLKKNSTQLWGCKADRYPQPASAFCVLHFVLFSHSFPPTTCSPSHSSLLFPCLSVPLFHTSYLIFHIIHSFSLISFSFESSHMSSYSLPASGLTLTQYSVLFFHGFCKKISHGIIIWKFS